MSEPVSAPAPPPTTVHNTWNNMQGYVFVPSTHDPSWGHWVSIGGAIQSQ